MSTRFLCIPAEVFKPSKGAFRETISLSLRENSTILLNYPPESASPVPSAHATSTQPARSTSQVGAGIPYVQINSEPRSGMGVHTDPIAWHVTSVTAPARFVACAKNAQLLDGLLRSPDYEEFVFRQWIGLANTFECITPKVADSLVVAKGHDTKTESRVRAKDALPSHWHDHRTPGGVPNSPNYPHQSEKNSWIATGTGAATVPWRMVDIRAHKGVVVLAKRGLLVVRVKT
ncbi:hypothetical protein V8E53_012244 [Lactarius tabidus]